jgi:peptide deformylase
LAIRRIVKTNDPDSAVLRAPAREVRRMDRELKRLLDDMVDTMREAPGVGLAAPQVGIDLRVIVVETVVDDDADADADTPPPADAYRLHRLINPVIVWRSEDTAEDQEACLSIPGLYGDVPRHSVIRVQAMTTSWSAVELELTDFEARVFQHEIDHLNGVLFPDRVTGLDKLYRLHKVADGDYERVPYHLPA